MTVHDMIAKTCDLDPGKDYNTEIIDGKLWVFFHASWSWRNWLRNFDVRTQRCNDAKVHKGYLREYTDSGFVVRELETVFVGYSRGAAIALLYYFACKNPIHHGVFNVKAILIGAPRLFRQLPQNFDISGITTVTYGDDMVTHLPPWFLTTPSAKHISLISTTKWPFRRCKDHGQYGSSYVNIEV